jgi:hypothetical protein
LCRVEVAKLNNPRMNREPWIEKSLSLKWLTNGWKNGVWFLSRAGMFSLRQLLHSVHGGLSNSIVESTCFHLVPKLTIRGTHLYSTYFHCIVLGHRGNFALYLHQSRINIFKIGKGEGCNTVRSLVKWKAIVTSRLPAGNAWLTAKRYEAFPIRVKYCSAKTTKSTYLNTISFCREPGSESCVQLYQRTHCRT